MHFFEPNLRMVNDYSQFEQRKKDHIELALMQSNQAIERNAFDNVSLRHEALPDLNFNEIDISTTRFGKKIPIPFLVSSMTAGHQDSLNINHTLISACEETGWAMGVGSQRRELTDKSAAFEWSPLRKAFPNVCLYSNLGIAQLISSPTRDVIQLAETLEAQALIIHCNPLQESIQPEGTTEFKGSLKAIEKLVKESPYPIIIKETGCGFSKQTLRRLSETGVAAVDVSGLGGTHWGRIEGHRAANDPLKKAAAVTFKNWGIDTVQSVKNAVEMKTKFEIWGSGGVRHGLDAAKLFALGATSVCFAKPMLDAAVQSTNQVITSMLTIEYELKVAMFCTGSHNLQALQEAWC